MPEQQSVLMRAIRTVRDAWLVLGVALLLLLALEGLYRLQAAGKRALGGPVPRPWASPEHPNHGQAWYPEFAAALDRRAYALDPYRGYWPKPLASPYLNIDASGIRRTPQAAAGPGARRVLLFGGSAAWGLTVRDSFTIAAQLARALARHGVTDVELVSLAQPGFNATQEAAAFQLALAGGERPAAAIFFNGYNDAAAGIISGRAGFQFAENDAQTLVDRGRRGFWAQIAGLAESSALITRLRETVRRPPVRVRPTAEAVCPAVGAWYGSVERGVLAIARDRGFPALIFLQPHNAMSAKRRTPWEEPLVRDDRLRACTDSMTSVMAPFAGTAFFDLRPVFDGDTVTRFVDFHAHVTEAASGVIADTIAAVLAPLLSGRPAR